MLYICTENNTKGSIKLQENNKDDKNGLQILIFKTTKSQIRQDRLHSNHV